MFFFKTRSTPNAPRGTDPLTKITYDALLAFRKDNGNKEVLIPFLKLWIAQVLFSPPPSPSFSSYFPFLPPLPPFFGRKKTKLKSARRISACPIFANLGSRRTWKFYCSTLILPFLSLSLPPHLSFPDLTFLFSLNRPNFRWPNFHNFLRLPKTWKIYKRNFLKCRIWLRRVSNSEFSRSRPRSLLPSILKWKVGGGGEGRGAGNSEKVEVYQRNFRKVSDLAILFWVFNFRGRPRATCKSES